MSGRLRSLYASVLIHERTHRLRRATHELGRRIRRAPQRAIFFHRVGDAWSWLLAQMLPEILADYAIELEIKLVSALPIDCVPEPQPLDRYAAADAMRLARAWSLEFPDSATPPPVKLVRLAERTILARPALDNVLQATAAAWRHEDATLAAMAASAGAVDEETAEAALSRNHHELVRRGHYLGGMIWYQGEWFWGLDRLGLFESRLRDRGLGDKPVAQRRFDPVPRALAGGPVSQSLEFFFSFRSPYSYLAANRVCDMADRLGLELILRPLLPMAARGIPVARRKLIYILGDVARVARQQGQPFGPLRDPFGRGVERCLAVMHYAQQRGLAREFMLAALRAIWCRAADLTTDRALAMVAAEAGLAADDVSAAVSAQNWRAAVEANAAALAVLGLWGVPSFCLRGPDDKPVSVAWGQDRLWAIERAVLGIDVAIPPPGLVQ